MNLQKMAEMMKKAQREVEKKLSEFEEKTYDFDYKNGAVIVLIKGNLKIEKITINPTLIDPEDKTMLEEMIVEAVNNAVSEIEKQRDALASSSMPSMPGIF